MKIIKLSLLSIITIALFSCNQTSNETSTSGETLDTNVSEEKSDEVTVLNVDSLVNIINEKRTEIENNLGEAVSVSTDSLREKIKQKWEKIDFYTLEGQVVRIKTYPYASITKRTEEFYLTDENLILAVIEDNGEGEKGKEVEAIDKLYYFNDNELVKEIKAEDKEEFSVKSSDAEELVSEVNEYLEIFKNK